MEKELQITNWEDWYQVTPRIIREYGGAAVLKNHGNKEDSHVKAIMAAYPQLPWKVYKFGSLDKEFWSDKRNQRDFFDDYGKKLEVVFVEDWYRVKPSIVHEHPTARSILENFYGGSFLRALNSIYHEVTWDSELFHNAHLEEFLKGKNPRDKHHQRAYLDFVGKIIGVSTWEDWYKVPLKNLSDPFGNAVTDLYGKSRPKMMQSVFPEYPWRFWRFSHVPEETWKDEKNQREFLQFVAKELGITDHNQWLHVPKDAVIALGGSGLLNRHNGSLHAALIAGFPEHQWNFSEGDRV
eukprot:TRINITY_DN9394_c0_g1_i1.p1 TRINITY_DN9394_c0_g1~~TRINITY_DN9394_c0_g1_i1.p1  ORF type:complete len:346 (-),score=54.43 TRINITY_DN9394_c0_g1_i1:1115-1999(-)